MLRWKGSIDAPPVAFVGKGITFDTGGICIKPAAGMGEMRGDMAGAAACAGAMLALALRNSPAPAIAVLPLAENATGAASYRPGDVLRLSTAPRSRWWTPTPKAGSCWPTRSAWTAAQSGPQAMIDLATLTGSIVAALGPHMAGLFGNDAALAAQVAAAGAVRGRAGLAHADRRQPSRGDLAATSPICAIACPSAASRMPATPRPSCANSWATRPGRISTSPAWSCATRRTTATPPAPPASACGCWTGWWRSASRIRTGVERMAEIGFYHLTRTGPDQALPRLLGRTLAAGQRAVVLCGSEERVAALDAALWLCPDPDWLPHGTARSGDAELQPIWITATDEAPNGARFLFLLDGADGRSSAAFDRVFDLFDGGERGGRRRGAPALDARRRPPATR